MLKHLLKSVREYKKASILTPLFVSAEVVIECFIPLLIAKLVDAVQAGASMKELASYGLPLVLMALLSLTMGALSGHYCAVASSGFAKNLRHDVYSKIQEFSFANIDKFSSSSLVTRLTTDVANVEMAYMTVIRIAIRCPFMIIFAFVMSVNLAGRIALIFAGIVPVLAFLLFSIIRKAHPLFVKVFKKYDKLNESIQENIRGMRVVKSFVREDEETGKFTRAARDVQADFTRAEKLVALNAPSMQLCIYAGMLLISFFVSRVVISTNAARLGVGTMTGMLTYSMQILMSMMMVSVIFVMVVLSIESARRIVEVLEEESTLTNPESPVETVENGSVDFNRVTFRYNEKADKPALDDVDVHIPSGSTVGIIGGTGSSKTTLISLISRLYDASSGSVFVGGRDVRDYDLDALRRQVAVVLQKNVLFSGTIKDNLRWGDPDASDEELENACRLACADEFIETFPDGYDTYIEQGGTNVSGGQKQRLCIARALLRKPKVLILDDSTSAVDTRTDARIRKALREFIPETTKIIVAQRIASVSDADMIIVMDDGRIDAVGTHEELCRSNEIYKEIYESQTKGGEDDAE